MKKISKFLTVLILVSILLPALAGAVPVDGSTQVDRLGGDNRVLTSIEVSKVAYPKGAKTVVLAGWSGQADALTGTLLANAKDAPMLLTRTNSLDPKLAQELKRLNPERIYVLGGTTVVKESVLTAIKALNKEFKVERVAGSDRFKTAVAAAEKSEKPTNHIFLANGYGDLADALAAGPASAKETMPILLTGKDKVPAASLEAMDSLKVTKITIVGGTAAVSKAVESELEKKYTVNRLFGADREETAKAIAGEYFKASQNAILANGYGSPDALVGGYLGALKIAPILLTSLNTMKEVSSQYLSENIDQVFILGGTGAVSEKIAAAVVASIDDELKVDWIK